MYRARVFNNSAYHGNNKFDINALLEYIRHISLNIFARGSHKLIIERSIQTIKQESRCTTHSVTYKKYTNLMKRSLVACIIHSWNYFPQKFSIINKIGANTILLGNQNPYFNMKIILFGSYAMVYTGIKSNIRRGSIPGIALRESN